MKHQTLLSGLDAIAALPRLQSDMDRALGLNTAGFISGYRGSPLGGLDTVLMRRKADLYARNVVFRPAINEELAATAIWGTQQGQLLEDRLYDGVFALWYGKGPGVDRAGDALRHGNMAGAAAHGGVLVVAGDDHAGKSSTTAHQSEHSLSAYAIPVLSPASNDEIVRLGLLGWAMSRYAGLWVGLKCVNDIAEAAAVTQPPAPPQIRFPDPEPPVPPEGVNVQWRHEPAAAEARHFDFKLSRAIAFARANDIDTAVIRPQEQRIAIVTTGKAYGDVLSALELLGLTAETAAQRGIGLHKIGLVWPIDPDGLRAFAKGYGEILFIEEKRDLIEAQGRAALYNLEEGERPQISGKTDPSGRPLLPATGSLDARLVASVLFGRLKHHGLMDDDQREHHGDLLPPQISNSPGTVRLPYFCSGCPHNRSTKIPDDALALSGIGCHTMAVWMNRQTMAPTQMGGEGANWMGIAPFSSRKHVFQNLGDGTYFHSGILAVRQAVAAKLNITYKVLFNAAVAMTGGQRHDGDVTPGRIAAQVLAEGVAGVAVVSEFPHHIKGTLPAGATLHSRNELQTVQRRLANIDGVTVLVFDQTCALEKRRQRKRGMMSSPTTRFFIAQDVCEGCGDCSVKSNCVSIKPLATPLGMKRHIDQPSCNQDFSCADGFCPSFVSVRAKPLVKSAAAFEGAVPPPAPFRGTPRQRWNITLAGIGGTGVVTLGQIIARAAAHENMRATTVDMTGLAQKNGAVLSHIRLNGNDRDAAATHVPPQSTDLLLACDQVAAISPAVLALVNPKRTTAIAEAQLEPTAHVQIDPAFQLDGIAISTTLSQNVRDYVAVPATEAAKNAFGLHEVANTVLLGFAVQRGLLPFALASVEAAIREAGVAIDTNLAALNLGRHLAETQCGENADEYTEISVNDRVRHWGEHLSNYQGPALKRKYLELLERVAQAEAAVQPGSEILKEAVAVTYPRLLAFKDEYEVARLLTSPEFSRRLETAFGKGVRAHYHLAPPFLTRTNPETGEPDKMRFGPWLRPALKAIAGLRFLRGTAFDPFGLSADRKEERALVTTYEALVEQMTRQLRADTLQVWAERLAAPAQIKGFGPVKKRAIERWRTRDHELSTKLNAITFKETKTHLQQERT